MSKRGRGVVGRTVLWSIVALPLSLAALKATQDAIGVRSAKEQYRLARLDGLPTTAQELIASMPDPSVKDNAAPYYQQLRMAFRKQKDKSQDIERALLLGKPGSADRAKKFLAFAHRSIEIVDAASGCKNCAFDREWEKGFGTAFPELHDVRVATSNLLLRATLASVRNQPDAALQDVDRVWRIAGHLKQEPIMISRLVAQSIERSALDRLASWSFMLHEPRFKAELEARLPLLTQPNPKAENLCQFYGLMQAIDEDNVSTNGTLIDRLGSFVVSPAAGRAEVAAGSRQMMKALALDEPQQTEEIKKADARILDGFRAFPAFYKAFKDSSILSVLPSDELRELEAQKQVYEVALNLMESTGSHQSRLVSAADHQAIRVQREAQSLVIDAGQMREGGRKITLHVPPQVPRD